MDYYLNIMIMSYLNYINENQFTSTQGKLFIEDGDENITDWKLVIDVSKIWEKFENNNFTVEEFNKQYSNYLIEKKDIITQYAGEKFYYELQPIIEELQQPLDSEKSESAYNKIYDLCDEYEVLLKTEK